MRPQLSGLQGVPLKDWWFGAGSVPMKNHDLFPVNHYVFPSVITSYFFFGKLILLSFVMVPLPTS